MLAFAVSAMLYIMADVFAPLMVSIISQFFLPIQNFRSYRLGPHNNQKALILFIRVTLLHLFLIFVLYVLFDVLFRSVYKELHADHETGAADNK